MCPNNIPVEEYDGHTIQINNRKQPLSTENTLANSSQEIIVNETMLHKFSASEVMRFVAKKVIDAYSVVDTTATKRESAIYGDKVLKQFINENLKSCSHSQKKLLNKLDTFIHSVASGSLINEREIRITLKKFLTEIKALQKEDTVLELIPQNLPKLKANELSFLEVMHILVQHMNSVYKKGLAKEIDENAAYLHATLLYFKNVKGAAFDRMPKDERIFFEKMVEHATFAKMYSKHWNSQQDDSSEEELKKILKSEQLIQLKTNLRSLKITLHILTEQFEERSNFPELKKKQRKDFEEKKSLSQIRTEIHSEHLDEVLKSHEEERLDSIYSKSRKTLPKMMQKLSPKEFIAFAKSTHSKEAAEKNLHELSEKFLKERGVVKDAVHFWERIKLFLLACLPGEKKKGISSDTSSKKTASTQSMSSMYSMQSEPTKVAQPPTAEQIYAAATRLIHRYLNQHKPGQFRPGLISANQNNLQASIEQITANPDRKEALELLSRIRTMKDSRKELIAVLKDYFKERNRFDSKSNPLYTSMCHDETLRPIITRTKGAHIDDKREVTKSSRRSSRALN
jgi:hypothetical protein